MISHLLEDSPAATKLMSATKIILALPCGFITVEINSFLVNKDIGGVVVYLQIVYTRTNINTLGFFFLETSLCHSGMSLY